MNREHSAIYRKTKAAILLLCLFFMMVNTCPVRGLLTSAFTPAAEFSKQSYSSETFVFDDLRCAESEVTEVALLDFSKSSSSSLPLPLFLTVVSAYLSLSVLSLCFALFKKETNISLSDHVPLFLRNRSIII